MIWPPPISGPPTISNAPHHFQGICTILDCAFCNFRYVCSFCSICLTFKVRGAEPACWRSVPLDRSVGPISHCGIACLTGEASSIFAALDFCSAAHDFDWTAEYTLPCATPCSSPINATCFSLNPCWRALAVRLKK